MKTIKSRGFSTLLKILVPCFIALLFSSASPLQDKPGKPGQKPSVIHFVRICHEGQTLMVRESELKEHLQHGDGLGYCPDIIKPDSF